jgi:hypothetical protein
VGVDKVDRYREKAGRVPEMGVVRGGMRVLLGATHY